MLKPREYYLMLALSDDARHGLAIAREVDHLSDGAIHLWPATLYGTLDDLVQRGWIQELAQHPVEESEKKRFYALTRSGRAVLAAETDRLAALVKVARARLRRSGAAS
jgi:DNA-binding PadR family transcriptional regulator